MLIWDYRHTESSVEYTMTLSKFVHDVQFKINLL